jgi:hypothetical protein
MNSSQHFVMRRWQWATPRSLADSRVDARSSSRFRPGTPQVLDRREAWSSITAVGVCTCAVGCESHCIRAYVGPARAPARAMAATLPRRDGILLREVLSPVSFGRCVLHRTPGPPIRPMPAGMHNARPAHRRATTRRSQTCSRGRSCLGWVRRSWRRPRRERTRVALRGGAGVCVASRGHWLGSCHSRVRLAWACQAVEC